MARPGKRPVLDDGKKREILAIVAAGGSRRAAARYVGCSPSTIANTARREPEFGEALLRRESAAEIGYLRSIQSASRKAQYWRAAAWALERRNPEDFAARRPDVITLKQIRRLMAQFARIIVEEVPNARDRKAILKRLDALTASLGHGGSTKSADKEALR